MKTNYTKKGRVLCLLTAVFMCLSGCESAGNPDTGQEHIARENAGQTVDESAGQTVGESAGQTVEENTGQTVDWNSHRITSAAKEENGSQWHLRESFDSWITLPEAYSWKSSSFYNSPGGDFCALTQYALYNEDGSFSKAWNCLDYFDTETADSLHTEISPDAWGLPKTANLALADVVGDRLVACYFYTTEETGTPRSYCSVVFYHMENGVQKTLDLLPALTAAGMVDNIAPFSEKNILCDQNGCCYIVLEDKLLIVGDTGQLLLLEEPQDDAVPLAYLCRTPEGLPVFVSQDLKSRSNTYWIFDQDAGEMRSLGQSGYMSLPCGCMDSHGNIYYLTSMGILVRWNTLSGRQENIFDCGANSICGNMAAEKRMAVQVNGNILILDPVTEKKNIYVLSQEAPAEERVLTLVSACNEHSLEQTAAALYSMKKPGVRIAFSTADGEDFSSCITNLTNRIVAGDAPDMFIVPAETMHMLYEKGALADLSDVIPEQLRDQVFGCVWNVGTIDGKLMGLTTGISCHSMLVSDDLCPGDTWTLTDMLDLADQAPQNTLKGLIPLRYSDSSPSELLYEIALRDMETTFVDRNAGTCHFDGETFRRLLEYCKNTPVPETDYSRQNPDLARMVVNGEYIACSCWVNSLLDFSDQMSFFPENYHWIGVPTYRESGNLVSASDFLVVSKDTENMDLIREFLPTLYGDEIARKYPYNCLRRDVLRSQVVIPDWGLGPQFNKGEGTYVLLAGKPDGTSYVEEYIAFLDSCIPSPVEDEIIASIVLEEAQPYFSGDKNIDTVIGIIQSRVQLYLDENNF